MLSTEKGRKTVGWVIAAILSPLILLAAFLCSFGTAAEEHNNFAVSASFYGPAFTDKIPTEYKDHITEMRRAFSLLDSAVAAVNAKAESGGLDPLQVKAVFYALCFGDDAPTRRAAANFVECFYHLEERTDTTTDVLEDGTVVVQTTVYYVAVPLPLETVYEKLAAWQGEPVTEEDKANAAHMYYNATRKGTIDTIPEVPGLAVWKSGHIGVYIGGGQVIEAMGTKYGVVKTQLQGRGWTHWLEIPYINYD